MCSGKYIEIYFSFKITFPIIRLPEHLISTISVIDPDGGMCNSKRVEAEGMPAQDRSKLTNGGLMPEPIPQEEYWNCQCMCQSQEGQN